MDGFDHSTAPPEYNELKWLADIFVIGMAVGWVAHYVEMIHISFKDQTYCMTIGGLCINFAWEIIFCTMYPAKGFVERVAFLMGISLDLGVIYAGIKNAPNEWHHSVMVRDHMPLVFAATTICCLSGHMALTAHVGPAQAYTWGAIACQLFISIGNVFQLLSRGNTRGASWTLWISRFFGSTSAIGFALVRYIRWWEAFSWLNCPLVLWSVVMFFLFEILYGALFYSVKRQEGRSQCGIKHKER
ncbi:uncharacterized protein BO87DRAFT_57449 [Aspergillus neoniger CBS 115656]|uniref:PaxB n=1 Tax=Aspergillus neoniger (strain CBS 115656) TaxID=1448310 RepID=A0A318YII9_ASPNB|nr:hypothetical protein BO87DRAFT_57449 [Aspergillus neoniger CBS 115656]PYH34351.1 hypothetical protein BO87DRAFT_57449 [Aspergillus neoniger CBS 115656]